jgi:hypothetical protein
MPEVGDAMSQMRGLSFGGIEFPFQEITWKGGLDDYEHKYPHTNGAACEKLGRRLYLIGIKTDFHNDLAGEEWKDLYPNRLQVLIGYFERQETWELQLPHRAPYQAYCCNWSSVLTVKTRSGEAVDLEFKEDRNKELSDELKFKIERRSTEEQLGRLTGLAEDLKPKPSIFDEITDAVNGVLGYLDQAEMYGHLVTAKILDAVRLLQTADETLDALNQPAHHELLDALHELWKTLVDIKEDIFDQGSAFDEYIVPQEMTVTDVAIAVYHDASRAGDFVSLNVIPDSLAIPAGTILRHYPA